MSRFVVFAILGFALAGAASSKEHQMSAAGQSSDALPRPRDGDIAIQEELDAARRAGTVEAYDLFLARHGDHRLAGVARRERTRLAVAAQAKDSGR